MPYFWALQCNAHGGFGGAYGSGRACGPCGEAVA